MKGFIITLLLLFFACDKKVKTISASNSKTSKVENPAESKVYEILYNHTWFQYYQKENPAFKFENFQLKEAYPIVYQKSSVTIMNEKDFNEIYTPFFIFNESKRKYVDFDSYQWFPASDGYAEFEADQQVVLVDMKKKEARQIAFFGPSYWIEDAYWKGDSAVVLLGNSYEKVPFILKYNFEKNIVQNFQYPDTLKIETTYSKMRLRSKGIKVD